MTKIRRFYREVRTQGVSAGGWQILFDEQPAKTPLGHRLTVPTRALAEAIAGEWRSQADELRPDTMRLTRLANTAIDRVSPDRQRAVAELLRFAGSDLVCFRAPAPHELVERQAAVWDPLVRWMGDRYGVALATTSEIEAIEQPNEALSTLESTLSETDDFILAGLVAAANILGSAVLALALCERRFDALQALQAAELDTAYQADFWGEDPEVARRNLKKQEELFDIAIFFDLNGAV